MMTIGHDLTAAGAGLFGQDCDTKVPVAIPLLGVDVKGRVVGGSAEVVMRQRYRNDGAVAIEAVYVFPLPADAAVCGFAAEVDGLRVVGRVESREKAFEVYDDAIADGHGAFLLDAERPDIFTMSVGNLKAGSEAIVELRWVTRLHTEGPAWRFVLPTTVAARYVPASPAFEVGQPDADLVNPPKAADVPYGLTFALDIDPQLGRLKRVESPTHQIRVTLGETPRVELSQEETALDRDVVIFVEPEARAPSASVAIGPDGERFVQVSFAPDFESDDGAPGDFVFILDCSGSMQGDSIVEARRALELCVRTLSEGDTFDIIRFGSSHESLFGSSRAYDKASFDAAMASIRGTSADLGGTELMAPLKAVFDRSTTRPRTVVLLTDGQVSNESETIELASRHKANHRVFAFGIGAGVSENLVRGLARVTRGEAEFIAPGERVEPKVLRQFGRMRRGWLDDVSIDWGGLAVEQAPRVVPGVFAGDPLIVSGRVASGTASTVTLRAGGRSFEVPLDLGLACEGGPIPQLWAHAAIMDLEDSQARRGSAQKRDRADTESTKEAAKEAALVALGRRFGLVSSATSYVAVELRDEAGRTVDGPTLVRVPTRPVHNSPAGLARACSVPMSAGMAQPAPPPSPSPAYRAGGPPARKSAMPMAEAKPEASSRRVLAKLASAIGDAFRGDRSVDPAPMRAFRANAAADEAVAVPRHEADPLDGLFALLAGQQSDGSFAAEVVCAAVSDAEALRALLASLPEDDRVLKATAVAIETLQTTYAAHSAIWAAAVKKAERFIQGRD